MRRYRRVRLPAPPRGPIIFSTIQYAETGVILNVTPHINAGRPGPARTGTDDSADGRHRYRRRQQYRANIYRKEHKDHSSCPERLNGGNRRNNRLSEHNGKTGIPYLQDIPLLSPLFSARNTNLERTELLVAITPHVIDQRGSEAPTELLQKLNNLKQRVGQ